MKRIGVSSAASESANEERSRSRATLLALAGALLMMALPGAAVGADAADLIKEGIALRRKGDDAGALEKFQQAHRLQESPRTFAQMALAEQALGRWAAAHDHLVAALEGRSDPWIAKNRGTLVDSLKAIEQHVGKLDVLGEPRGAEVRINGVLRGALPLTAPLTVATGTVTVDLAAPGHHPAQRITTVRAGQMTRESFDPLTPVLKAADPSPRPVLAGATDPSGAAGLAAGGAPGLQGEPGQTANPRPGAGREPSALRLSAKWIAGGAAVLALAGGTVAYVLHNAAADEFNDSCWLNANGDPAPVAGSSWTNESCRGKHDSVNLGYRLSVVGFVAGTALAAAAVMLWVTEPKPAGPVETAFACLPTATATASTTTVALGCRLRF